ncbi:hypothetical protein K458DRAFT_291837, partial [Lentithecium fluviatile CBS 122367]
TFPSPSLPTELRNQIRHDALSNEMEPAFAFYKTGCCQPRGADPDLYVVFRHDLLDAPQIDMPLAFVNHEARGIALAWIREKGLVFRR